MDIIKLSAIEMNEKLRNKEISSREIVEAHFDKIEEIEGKLNAFITLNKEEALKAADKVDNKLKNNEELGILAGIPIGIKDNIVTKDLKTTCASKMLENFIPPYDATVVEKIKNADGIIIGKTNMDEFAMGSSTETSYFGSTKNPVDTEKVSGGSAASVKANEVALSLGSDTGGSIRQPASLCGVVGIKPTYGLVSRYGLISNANTLDQIGVLGRDVRDSALMLSSIMGHDNKDSTSISSSLSEKISEYITSDSSQSIDSLKGMKIALPKEFMNAEMNRKIKEEIERAIKLFEDAGAKIEEVSLPSLNHSLEAYCIISTAEISSNMARFDGVRYGYRSTEYKTLDELYINTRTEAFGEEVKRRILLGTYFLSRGYGGELYQKALKVRTLVKEDFNKTFEKYDIILSPSSATLPFEFGEKTNHPLPMYKTDFFTVPVNLAGICAMSVPCGSVEGLPVGLQIIGDRFKDINIIKAGLGFEGMVKNNGI